MSRSAASLISPRLVLGVIIMALGVLFFLDNLDVLAFDDAIRWWPLAPIAIGLALALQTGGTGNRGFGLFLIGAGIWALLNELGIVDLEFWDVFPVLLIAVGGWLIWRATTGQTDPLLGPSSPDLAPGDPRSTAADTVSAFGFLRHVEQACTSRSFQGADLTAIMGGCTVDLRGADIGPEPAVIDAFAFWGGIEILVPPGWVVTNKVLPLLGAADDATRPVPGASKQLLVRGTSMMAGVEIANEKTDD